MVNDLLGVLGLFWSFFGSKLPMDDGKVKWQMVEAVTQARRSGEGAAGAATK